MSNVPPPKSNTAMLGIRQILSVEFKIRGEWTLCEEIKTADQLGTKNIDTKSNKRTSTNQTGQLNGTFLGKCNRRKPI